MNSKERRFQQRLPDDLKQITGMLPAGCAIASLESFGRSWRARIGCAKRLFELVSHHGYVDVSEVIDGGYRPVMPPESQRVTITLEQVCDLVKKELAQPPDALDGSASRRRK